jgi:nicotinamide phosphoribosyltransferase
MNRFDDNIILMTDSYKLSHYRQYPAGTENVFSYFESRVGAKFPYTVFFGLQYFLRKYLSGRVVTQEKIDQAASIASMHMGGGDGTFNREGWEYIEKRHNGFLPVRIKAVPEGTKVPTGNVLMTIEALDPKCYWLVNYLETLLVQVWYPCTVATLSHQAREIIKDGLIKTGGDLNGLPFKLHDFGFRGVSSVESAGLGGLAHLVNFMGTDTLKAITTGMEFYDSGMCGFSIPASEHSTMTSWGEANEAEAMRNMLTQYPTGLVACVSDSFDIDRACSEYWGKDLKEEVLSRDGVLVVRPDSGEIVPMVLNVLTRLGDAFGTYENEKGFRVLNDKVRVIQGDGCTLETIAQVVDAMIENNWSVDNIAFGMGGGLLQKVDRDTQRFAFKASSVTVNGKERDVFKRPASDPTKNSKRGRLALIRNGYGELETVSEKTARLNSRSDVLRTVFERGEVTKLDTLDQIRSRAATTLPEVVSN